MGDLFNLRKQLSFYGAYHSNPLNQLVHIICVPVIVWTALLLLSNQTDIFGSGLSNVHPLLVLNWGLLAAILYGGYYTILEPVAGAAASVLLFLGWIAANHVRQQYPEHLLSIFFVGQICSWVPQILAHKFIEGRSPALLDNLAQAFLLAPFFVFLEVLFKVGYRPDLEKDIRQDAQKNIDIWMKSQGKKAQ